MDPGKHPHREEYSLLRHPLVRPGVNPPLSSHLAGDNKTSRLLDDWVGRSFLGEFALWRTELVDERLVYL